VDNYLLAQSKVVSLEFWGNEIIDTYNYSLQYVYLIDGVNENVDTYKLFVPVYVYLIRWRAAQLLYIFMCKG